jgi:hypothetical protein
MSVDQYLGLLEWGAYAAIGCFFLLVLVVVRIAQTDGSAKPWWVDGSRSGWAPAPPSHREWEADPGPRRWK